MKRCTRCRRSKRLNAFGANRTAADGKATYCKQCKVSLNAEYFGSRKGKVALRAAQRRLRERYRQRNVKRNVYDRSPKVCQRCKESKPRTRNNWTINRPTRDGLDYICRACQHVVSVERRAEREAEAIAIIGLSGSPVGKAARLPLVA